jgi:GT2 family glycosyltransferase
MLLYEVTQVVLRTVPSRVMGPFSVDAPLLGGRVRPHAIEVSGWVIGVEPVRGVEIVRPDGATVFAPLTVWRDDILALYPALPGAERSGYRALIDIGTPDERFSLTINAVNPDDTRIELAIIQFALLRRERPAPRPGRNQRTAGAGGEAPAPNAAPEVAAQESGELLSIIIPVHNKSGYTRACLERLTTPGNIGVPHEIIVVDDGSTDDTVSLLKGYAARGVRSVRLSPNVGFSRACNAGASSANGQSLIFLNNDTLPEPGWAETLARYARQHPKAGIVGSKLLFPDGTVQHAGVSIAEDGYPHHIYAGLPGNHPVVNKARKMRLVTAACCLIRASLFKQLGGFDPGYLNGWEDSDFGLRAERAGWESHYCPESVVVHFESVSRVPGAPRERANRLRWEERWYGNIEPDQLKWLLADGMIEVRPFPAYSTMYPWRLIYSRDAIFPERFGKAPLRDRLRTTRRASTRRYRRPPSPNPGEGAGEA